MSGIKEKALTDFYRSLHDRRQTTELLAAKLDVSGGTVRKLIGMHAPRGGATWRFLLALLTDREKELLQSMEQSSTWNTSESEKSSPREAKTA
jgi:DNA-binding CsgD family transcriptional regulator